MAFGRRAFLFGTGAAVGGWAGWRLAPRLPSSAGIVPVGEAVRVTILDDASELNPTRVRTHLRLSAGPVKGTERRLQEQIAAAAQEDEPLAISAARHTMGGHSIPEGGRAVDLGGGFLDVASDEATYRAHAGMRWRDVIAALDPQGLSPKVMQGNDDFGIGASFSVNAHGWAAPHGVLGATVRSVDMLDASGRIVRASRDRNPETFAMAMGGYGLFGPITSLKLEAVPNQRLRPSFRHVAGTDLGAALAEAATDDGTRMAYGRLDVARETFLSDALLVSYAADPDQDAVPLIGGGGSRVRAPDALFDAQLGSDVVRRVRWFAEWRLGPLLGAGPATRNALLSVPVPEDIAPDRTRIMHGYFVPPDAFARLLEACRGIILESYQEPMDATLRYVASDPDSVLNCAPEGPRLCLFMRFSQEKTARAEADMARMTALLIDRVLTLGGSYYLPFRPHASRAQFEAAYPRAAEFAAAKRRADPDLRFRNGFWDRYLAAL